jgi:hypothetical protein
MKNVAEVLQNHVDEYRNVKQQMAQLSLQMAKCQEVQDNLLNTILPGIFKEAQLSEFTVASGETIKSAHTLNATIVKGQEEKAYQWLRANKQGEIIKQKVELIFKDSERTEADKIFNHYQNEGYEVKKTVSVPWNTLSAKIRKMGSVEKEKLPTDILEVKEYDTITITL